MKSEALVEVKKEASEEPLLTLDLLPTRNDASWTDFEGKTDIEGGKHLENRLALKPTLRFSSESTLVSTCVKWDMKNDSVKIEDSKEGIPQHPEISSATSTKKVKLEDDVSSSSLAVPLQKRRRLQLEVVVPTLDLLRRQTSREKPGDDYVQMLKKMKNPKIKKKSDKQFSLSTVWARTKEIPAFEVPLDKETQEFTVSRDFMASTYGGSMQATCPTISKRRLAQHGKDGFTYLHLDYHQEAPEVAGSPGLFFNSSSGRDWQGLQRVFTRIASNKWQFMGMYEFKSCASLTKEEWKSSKEKVRNTWTREICRQGWAQDVRARVRGRIDLGREPTKVEVKDIITSGRFRMTTPDEVMKAYNSGEERIGVWTMKCVEYDLPFQLELCKKFPLWIPSLRKPKGSKKDPKKSAGAKSANSQSRGRKRKRSESLLSELMELSDEESDNELKTKEQDLEKNGMDVSDADSKPIYTSKGTRSRPICL